MARRRMSEKRPPKQLGRPGFNEAAYGCKSFNDLLDEAAARGLLELERDEKSGGYVIRRIVR